MYYFQFNISDWTHSTSWLTPIQELIYFKLICHYYDTEKPIPKDYDKILRRLRLIEHKDDVRLILSEYFKENTRTYVHDRCEKELKKYKKKGKTSRENGKLGGRPNKNKYLEETQIEPSGNPEETHQVNFETQKEPGLVNQEPLTTNQETLTTNQELLTIKQETKNKETSKDICVDIFDYWKLVMNKPKSKLTPGRKSKIQARLKTYSVNNIKDAIDGCSRSSFHMGGNDNKTLYNSIELICRNDEKIESFIENFKQQSQQNEEAQRWINEQ